MPFVFSDCRLDPDRRELTRGAKTVAIGPQVFDLLLHLVQNRERVVSKDQLLDAVWDGRIVSDSTLTSHINALRKAIGDSGAEQRLIRTVARRGFRFVGEVTEPPPPSGSSESELPVGASDPVGCAFSLPDRPSIAVLAFVNLSQDSEQEYFVDGVVEDIISALSRMRWLFVIARNSSFTYKGRAVDVKQVGRELGVRYVLEGSVRKSEHRVRMTGQLIDATTGAHVWSERFESTLDDIFELQDQMTACVVGALAPHLERAEIERALRKPTENLNAYDYYLRGMWKFRQVSRSAIDEALPLFLEAIRRDPQFASVYAMAAWCHSWRKLSRCETYPEADAAEGARLARRAVELGPDDAVALAGGGYALAHLARDLDSGIALIERATVLNPNHAAAWYLGGFLRIWRGEPEEAIERISRGMRLSPLGPDMHPMQVGMAMAHLLAGRTTDALSWAQVVSRDRSDRALPLSILAAIYARAGRDDDATRTVQQLRQLDPALRVSRLEQWLPFRREEDLMAFSDGLRRAGLAE
jgi:TolB-like protein